MGRAVVWVLICVIAAGCLFALLLAALLAILAPPPP